MKRPEEVQEALSGLDGFDCVSWYQEWFSIVYNYIDTLETHIKTLEMMVDSAYKELDKLDELV